jgi:glutamate---cysteine ligase / carboxylate-amine ligase
MRTVGVEEELLLVDVHTGKPRSVASQVIAAADGESAPAAGEGGVEAELQRYMVETQSSVASELADVEEELRRWRRVVASAAREAGAGVAAIATAPMAGAGLISRSPRYQRIAERFGPTAQEVTCGCHVHVSVESDEEGIAAIDRIRVWLPVILAISANSPFTTVVTPGMPATGHSCGCAGRRRAQPKCLGAPTRTTNWCAPWSRPACSSTMG